MNALRNKEVGSFLNEYFRSAYQRVGTFQKLSNIKIGGSVASYFCSADGRVLHSVAGPVNAKTLLAAAKWVVETTQNALEKSEGDEKRFHEIFRAAHERRATDTSVQPRERRIHELIARKVLAPIEEVYAPIFQGMLGQVISTDPVKQIPVQAQNRQGGWNGGPNVAIAVNNTVNVAMVYGNQPYANVAISRGRTPNGIPAGMPPNLANPYVNGHRPNGGTPQFYTLVTFGALKSNQPAVDKLVPFSCFDKDVDPETAATASPHRLSHDRWRGASVSPVRRQTTVAIQ